VSRPRAFQRLAALALAGGVLLAGCGERTASRLVRLGSLVKMPQGAEVRLPAGEASPGAPYQVATRLAAAQVARLRFTARGGATLATLTWKLAPDRGLPPYRSLSFPLVADGQTHAYEVDLQREVYWTGRVEALRLAVEGGRLELLELAAEPPSDPYRSMALHGETMPALPGVARIDVDLPPDLPRGTVFESRIGLVPDYDRPGVRADFRVYLEDGGQDRRGDGGARHSWLQQAIEGSSPENARWRLLRGMLPAGGGMRLSLEVSATRAGTALPQGVALWGDPLLATPGRPAGRSLIVILIDTQRADLLGAYGDGSGLTPHLDAFAREGVRFAEMVSPAPWTLPTVASLLTGLQPQTHGAGFQPQAAGAGLANDRYAPTGLPGGVRTLATTLAGRGFYTIGVYHNIYVNPAFGLQQGFDEYASLEEPAGVLVDEALARLRASAAHRPVFLYLHLFDLHNPYSPPAAECRDVARRFAPDYRGPLGCTADRRPELPLPPPRDWRWFEALYRAEIAYTDRQIGRFLAGLRDLGLEDGTVVAIVSDHGEEFWTRLDRERQLGYTANSDHGHTLYQELLHVPAIVRIPGRAPAVVPGAVEMVDLFPTLLRAVGVEPPPSQGVDLTPLLDGHPAAARPTLLADVILHGEPRWSVRRGPWKLIVPRNPALPVELYDLDHDPGELRDLAGREPRLVADLRSWGERELAARRQSRPRFLSGKDPLAATYLEWKYITRLRSLGYLK
jgi:arylsulfatase A-like enzyme